VAPEAPEVSALLDKAAVREYLAWEGDWSPFHHEATPTAAASAASTPSGQPALGAPPPNLDLASIVADLAQRAREGAMSEPVTLPDLSKMPLRLAVVRVSTVWGCMAVHRRRVNPSGSVAAAEGPGHTTLGAGSCHRPLTLGCMTGHSPHVGVFPLRCCPCSTCSTLFCGTLTSLRVV